MMEFLVEFDLNVPEGTPEDEVSRRSKDEASAASELAEAGHLLRVWRRPVVDGAAKVVGLYSAESEAELDGLLAALPLFQWMSVAVTTLEPHPNDPARIAAASRRVVRKALPAPRLTLVYRLEAMIGPPLDVGDVSQGHRRIVSLTGGTFTGPELNGILLPGASADWQIVLPDGTALGDIRYSLQTDSGDVIYVQSRSVRHGSAEVLARLGRGEEVDPSEYTFRASTQIETAAPHLDWLNKGIFISVGGREAAGVIYETYLVG
jgi:muconolactone delta-isomerase